MFTHETIGLAEFDGQFGLEVRRDCQFSFVGKVPTKLEGRVVPCGRRQHLQSADTEHGIAGIITTAELADAVPDRFGLAVAENPVSASLRLHEALLDVQDFQWKDFVSRIDPAAQIHPAAVIAERNVVIGAHTLIDAGAIVRERVVIGEHCRVGPGAVIGCDAFEVETGTSPWRVLRQGGGVMLEDHVEIEAKSTVVRSTFGGFTRLGRETKLDCQIHVAHDCDIGERVRIAACAEISGRVSIGDEVFVGPNCTISNGLTIGRGATVSLGSVLTRDVGPGERVTGNFAVPHRQWLRFVKSLGQSGD